ncbi:hypothetical protein ZWY2020_022626 [Hordeum vulgare]|nr:hypothetical protein ZWY2020_022626 [Hordeum vulgare]
MTEQAPGMTARVSEKMGSTPAAVAPTTSINQRPTKGSAEEDAGKATTPVTSGTSAQRRATTLVGKTGTVIHRRKILMTLGSGAEATPRRGADSDSRGVSKSPVESRTPDPASSLSARLGSMVLLDKEAQGFVFEETEQQPLKIPRWSAVGKVYSSKPMIMNAVEKAMQRAWGLHKEAKFRELGSNTFVVHFGSEGDWRHAMHNGPWQYDFNVLILKEYEGNTRSSEIVFDKVDIWVRVDDLPPGKRTEAFGKALGNWLGEIVRVDTGSEGFARGQYLRLRKSLFLNLW